MIKEKITIVIEIFKYSELSYEEIVAQINALAESIVNNYIEQIWKKFELFINDILGKNKKM